MFCGTIVTSADAIAIPAFSSAAFTSSSASGAVVTSNDLAAVGDVVGAGLERHLEELVLGAGALVDGDHALLREHPADAAGLAEVAAVLAEDVADLGDGAVAVVGEDLRA